MKLIIKMILFVVITSVNANTPKQQALYDLGFYGKSVNNNLQKYDYNNAIIKFQTHFKMDITGVLNDEQKAQLLKLGSLLNAYKKSLLDKNYNSKNNKYTTKPLLFFTPKDKKQTTIDTQGCLKNRTPIGVYIDNCNGTITDA